jgi:hypothetical protein
VWFDPPQVAENTTSSELRRWYPGERVGRLRASHSYGFVLALVVAGFVFAASAPDKDWAKGMLVLIESATLIVALWTSGIGHQALVPSIFVAAVGVGVLVAAIVVGDSAEAIGGVLGMALTLGTCAVLAMGIFDQSTVNRQSVLGAICIYVLIGILFTFLYSAVAAIGDGPFFAQGTDGTLSLRLYFSYVTLATLGYGDYTTAGNLGHTLSVSEALIGQLYLVTVIAVLVSQIGGRRVP